MPLIHYDTGLRPVNDFVEREHIAKGEGRREGEGGRGGKEG